MRVWRWVVCCGLIVFALSARAAWAQDYPPPDYVQLDPDDLQQLVAPVALYPDAVLSDVMVACTYPDDVIDADRWLAAGNNPENVDGQPWDDSVKSVARFPDLLHYMASHPDWMDDLGAAFNNQQDDVMDAVQALRSEALENGNLVSNEDQDVIQDGGDIEIIPANPDDIWLPDYDYTVIYTRRWHPGEQWIPLERFNHHVRVGRWLNHDFDWHDRRIYVGDWGRDRPWWHVEGHPVGRGPFIRHDYDNIRPGFGGGHGEAGHGAPAHTWERNTRKPAPHLSQNTRTRAAQHAPSRGFAPPAETGRTPRNEPAPAVNPQQGSRTQRESERGRESRNRATPTPPAAPTQQPREPRQEPTRQPREEPTRQPREEPTRQPREEPTRQPREEPSRRPAAPAQPAPRQEPQRGGRGEAPAQPRQGAMNGYQGGSDTARESGRGRQSRDSNPPASASPSPAPTPTGRPGRGR